VLLLAAFPFTVLLFVVRSKRLSNQLLAGAVAHFSFSEQSKPPESGEVRRWRANFFNQLRKLSMADNQVAFVSIKEGFQHTDLSISDMWVIYYSLGGTATADEVEAYLIHEGPLDVAQERVLAQGINEVFIDSGLNHPVPYPL
jgi:hypothetical protein